MSSWFLASAGNDLLSSCQQQIEKFIQRSTLQFESGSKLLFLRYRFPEKEWIL